MKPRFTKLAFCLVTLGLIARTQGQGTFQNLNFESANVPNLPPGETAGVPFSDALPGWTGYYGTNQFISALYNGVSVGGALVTLIGTNTVLVGLSNTVIGGNYTVTLDSGVSPSGIISAAIAQTSFIPATANSLVFSASGRVGDLAVTVNGQNIPFFPLDTGLNFTVYGGDISTFAGLTAELRFTERPISNPFAFVFLDDIFFSPEAIPEPSVFIMLALGALLPGRQLCKR